MKSFLKKTFIFTLLFATTAVLIFSVDDQELRYHQLEKDYAKSIWVYDKGIKHSDNIKYAFIGSSLLFTNVSDSILQAEKREKQIYNFAIPGDGRNLQHMVLRDLLEARKIDTLFIELRNKEARRGHFGYGFMAEGRDLLQMPFLGNTRYFGDIKNAVKVRTQIIKSKLGYAVENNSVWNNNAYGQLLFQKTQGDSALSKTLAEWEAARKSLKLPESMKALEYNMSIEYLQRMLKLANDSNCEIFFLYSPIYKELDMNLNAFPIYAQEKILCPPPDLLQQVDFWADPYHLNPQGAEVYTNWLLKTLNAQ